ncbi:hypothetical protein ABEX48_03530 [Bacillus tropicus]|uniref:hypothetical protein n=1 Tax=Bacillus tropicus TaxID=2026188 RepID=UPI002DBBC7ED|nr:hypothetical protein [Bacillus tropicus]MEC3087121.1 hypothetical protein [Bacillus tropicus]
MSWRVCLFWAEKTLLLFPYIAKISSWGLLVVNGIIIVAQLKEISYTDFALTKEGAAAIPYFWSHS